MIMSKSEVTRTLTQVRNHLQIDEDWLRSESYNAEADRTRDLRQEVEALLTWIEGRKVRILAD